MEKDYTTYDVLDLAQDPDFIQWVKNPTESLNVQWTGFIEQHPEKRDIVQEAQHLVEAVRFEDERPTNSRINTMWANIDNRTQERSGSGRIVSLKIMGWAAAAAIAIFFVFRFLGGETTIHTEYAAKQTHILPDGSSIALNAGSTITYEPDSWSESREINLKGEAFFNVEKGTPFRVSTSNGTVEVLGTSFNIYDRDDRYNVSCYTGKVRVNNSQSDQEVILTPGNRVNWSSGTLPEIIEFQATDGPDWQQGHFVYDKVMLRLVFEEVERQFDIDITADQDILSKTATVFFETGNLDSALYKITWPMGLTYEIEGDEVRILDE